MTVWVLKTRRIHLRVSAFIRGSFFNKLESLFYVEGGSPDGIRLTGIDVDIRCQETLERVFVGTE
jgi:hypothetical protein